MPQRLFQAPGRVNLIGEHTDYNQGFVLPCAIDRYTVMAVKLRNDQSLNVVAANLDRQRSDWLLQLPIASDRQRPWANYLRGVCQQFLHFHQH